jgi:sugar phosphate isomerase/epimerase
MIPGKLSLSLSGLTPREGVALEPRAAIEWAAGLGYRAVQLDATVPGVRPRELDRSARRDLAALLRRLELGFSGLDLWIPPSHYVEPAHADRALAATAQALELAADLARLAESENGAAVSLALADKVAGSTIESLASAADRVGARLADHRWPAQLDGSGPVGIGIDPAALLAAASDPASEVSRLAVAPAAARLSDAVPGGRVAVGDGRLDVLAYRVALATKGYARPVVVDLRAVRDQEAAARAALAAVP